MMRMFQEKLQAPKVIKLFYKTKTKNISKSPKEKTVKAKIIKCYKKRNIF